ncbi:MAG: S-layer homology domain-containing protein, partial [Paenibacillaceae bacterium]|nr:S-layer homology domain-containing protein [Paenibacillaceae bacterium]
FSPDQDITRAEFAAIVVRGLGLKLENSSTSFPDVKGTDWHSNAIQAAHAYGLIDGFNDGTFRPSDKITREQAMTIIAKAMKLTGLRDKMAAQSAEETLHSFRDTSDVATWAKGGIAYVVQAGIVSGRSADTLVPKDYMTRAEVAATIQRLLRQSGLI